MSDDLGNGCYRIGYTGPRPAPRIRPPWWRPIARRRHDRVTIFIEREMRIIDELFKPETWLP